MRNIVLSLVAVALLAAGGGIAMAGEIASSGFIEDVDVDNGTVQIKGALFRIRHRSQLFDDQGDRMELRQLVLMNPGPWVQYQARKYAGDAEITRIAVVPDD